MLKFSVLLLISFWAITALAQETIVVDDMCRAGTSRPPRQTIVLVDQAVISARPDIGSPNRRWINKILEIVGVHVGQPALVSLPGERITVIVSRDDGTTWVRMTACPPTSKQEEVEIRSKFNVALAALPRVLFAKILDGHQVPTGLSNSSFVKSFGTLAGTLNLREGTHRLVVISPLYIQELSNFSDPEAARAAGFAAAAMTGTDLQQSEIYLTEMSVVAGPYSWDFCHAFFQGMNSRLVDISGVSFPKMAVSPSFRP